jgi:hypothetical protein
MLLINGIYGSSRPGLSPDHFAAIVASEEPALPVNCKSVDTQRRNITCQIENLRSNR